MTGWFAIAAAGFAAAWWRERAATRSALRSAEHYRCALLRAEAALQTIADLEEIETATQTILTGDALAARLGVDIKSRLS